MTSLTPLDARIHLGSYLGVILVEHAKKQRRSMRITCLLLRKCLSMINARVLVLLYPRADGLFEATSYHNAS